MLAVAGVGLFVALLVVTLFGASLWWVAHLWKRYEALSWVARAVLLVMTTGMVTGVLGTLFGLAKAFGAVGGESIDPSQKARILAEGISEAMNCTGFGLLVFIPCAIALFFVTRGKTTGPK